MSTGYGRRSRDSAPTAGALSNTREDARLQGVRLLEMRMTRAAPSESDRSSSPLPAVREARERREGGLDDRFDSDGAARVIRISRSRRRGRPCIRSRARSRRRSRGRIPRGCREPVDGLHGLLPRAGLLLEEVMLQRVPDGVGQERTMPPLSQPGLGQRMPRSCLTIDFGSPRRAATARSAGRSPRLARRRSRRPCPSA